MGLYRQFTASLSSRIQRPGDCSDLAIAGFWEADQSAAQKSEEDREESCGTEYREALSG